MKVNFNPNIQSFSGYRFSGDGAKKFSERIKNSPDSQNLKRYLNEHILKPLKAIKSELIYDGQKVTVKHGYTGEVFEIPNVRPARPAPNNENTILYKIKTESGTIEYPVWYIKNQSSMGTVGRELELLPYEWHPFVAAREVALNADAAWVEKHQIGSKELPTSHLWLG